MDEFEKSWLLGAASDPQLADCSTVEELRIRLQKLSDALSNEDAKCPSSVFQQLTFDGTNANPCFEPNRFKKDLGVDGRKITAYYRYAVKSPEHAIAAVEFACDAVPSVLLAAEQGVVSPSTPKGGTAEAPSPRGPPTTASSVAQARRETGLRGALLQGGFKAVGNGKTCLVPFGVTHIVNTAKGLGNFFPKFKAFERSAAEVHQASTLHLDWVDGGGQPISAEALRAAVLFTHSARCAGGSVLVHCAQGRSRSGAVAVAYVAALLEMENGEAAAAAAAARGGEAVEGEAHSALRVAAAEGKAAALFTSTKVVDLALVVVQAGRRMAQPNPHFMAQLHAHAQAGLFKALARELVSSLAPPAEKMGDGGGGGGGGAGGSALNGASGGTKSGLNVPKECGDGCGGALAPADTNSSTSVGGPMRATAAAVAGAAQATPMGTSAAAVVVVATENGSSIGRTVGAAAAEAAGLTGGVGRSRHGRGARTRIWLKTVGAVAAGAEVRLGLPLKGASGGGAATRGVRLPLRPRRRLAGRRLRVRGRGLVRLVPQGPPSQTSHAKEGPRRRQRGRRKKGGVRECPSAKLSTEKGLGAVFVSVQKARLSLSSVSSCLLVCTAVGNCRRAELTSLQLAKKLKGCFAIKRRGRGMSYGIFLLGRNAS
mmetsp:Transcript_61124/g.119891  ORF Transcript_61124/g.119891 Transcript_61124/m.119891 type:complete len:655 (+) Transcript_61124:165-2129(+)